MFVVGVLCCFIGAFGIFGFTLCTIIYGRHINMTSYDRELEDELQMQYLSNNRG